MECTLWWQQVKNSFTKSIGKLFIGDAFAGTAWLINLQYAITAQHCIKNHTQNITLHFPDSDPITVIPIATDTHLDAALLQLSVPQVERSRLEIHKHSLANQSTWRAHGYPDIIRDRFGSGISITGTISNPSIQFDYSSVIQLLCSQSNNEVNLDDASLRGISGAPVMLGNNDHVIGIIRYAPLEFAERILIASPIDSIVKSFQEYLPQDLHITDPENEFEFSYFDDGIGTETENNSPPTKLKEFQKKIYTSFDDIGIEKFAHYKALSKQDKLAINTDILTNMMALNSSPSDLLELGHINTRFSNKQINNKSIQHNTDPWGMLHKKSAVYADHSVITIPPIRQYDDSRIATGLEFGADQSIDDRTINLLLQHRPLIELGKMSVVPELVKTIDQDYSENTIFNVADLSTTKVDLDDITIKNFYFRGGKMFKSAGTIVLNSPNSNGLTLDNIMEIIEAKHPDMYDYFQTHLKKLMYQINPEDDTHALKYALQSVDEGIQELDVKYQLAKGKQDQKSGSGILAIRLQSLSSNVMSFVNDAFSNSSLSSMVSFIPDTDPIPDEVRKSPFFIPWLIHHEGQPNVK